MITILVVLILSLLFGYYVGYNKATVHINKIWKKTCDDITEDWKKAYNDLCDEYIDYTRKQSQEYNDDDFDA